MFLSLLSLLFNINMVLDDAVVYVDGKQGSHPIELKKPGLGNTFLSYPSLSPPHPPTHLISLSLSLPLMNQNHSKPSAFLQSCATKHTPFYSLSLSLFFNESKPKQKFDFLQSMPKRQRKQPLLFTTQQEQAVIGAQHIIRIYQ